MLMTRRLLRLCSQVVDAGQLFHSSVYQHIAVNGTTVVRCHLCMYVYIYIYYTIQNDRGRQNLSMLPPEAPVP